MATAYKADTYADQQITAPWSVGQSWIRPFSFNIATGTASTGFIVNDTLALCPIPYKAGGYGVLVVGYQVEIPSLDTGTSVRLSLGDTNAASNAFQATFFSTVAIGINAAGVLHPLMGYSGTTATAPVRGVVPHQYKASAVYTTQSSTFPTVDFMLKVTTAPNTATTTGTIQGYLMLQTLNQSTVTF
jgi:hypothetical protein